MAEFWTCYKQKARKGMAAMRVMASTHCERRLMLLLDKGLVLSV